MTTPSRAVSPDEWGALAASEALAFLALWADTQAAYALYLDEAAGAAAPVRVAIEAGAYPALSPHRPAALLFERMVFDLWGHAAAGGHPHRPQLDHGRFGVVHPMAVRPSQPPSGAPEPPEFLAADGRDLHHVGLGPVHGGIAQPCHLRLAASGETVVRLEARLGYAHKGVLSLMRSKPPRAAARYAARLSGDSAVAHSIAFARAAEDATDTPAPPRAHALRAVMGELERLANHFGDIGGVCDGAGAARPAARAGELRELVVRACAEAFGHRLMMDCVIPGGVAADVAPAGLQAVARMAARVGAALPRLHAACGGARLGGRLAGAGVVSPQTARRFEADGLAARACGAARDARRAPGYPPYEALDVRAPTRTEGDAAARVALRFEEAAESLRLLGALLHAPPSGPVSVPLPPAGGEGVGVAEGFRGACWAWLRLDGGQIAAAFLRDPSWTAWPLLEAAMAGAEIADLPLVRRSINASCSGTDL